MSRVNRSMTIKVRDRATLFNLLVGLNGYTICTGIISAELNGGNIISRPRFTHISDIVSSYCKPDLNSIVQIVYLLI